MAPILGFTALLLLISFAIILSFVKKHEKIIAAIMLFCALFAQLCLIYSYAISDYSVLNVYQNSHHLKPLIYKISGSWGNHEGSMLLLITILCAYNFIFAIIDKSEFKKNAIAVQSLIIAAFASFTAFASNPFELIFPAQAAGLGLNPLLQDIGLALHPPMLYIGYIGFFITFALAISGLLQEKVNKNLAIAIQPYLFFSWSFLTLGIGLGSWWAYRELGWGGYWFFDPVENVSLMPWLASTALIHCVKVLQKKDQFKIWTILLSIITFILCLIGIFLVRSGLLTSVHSFAVDAKRGFFIIALILAIGGLALFLFALKIPKIKTKNQEQEKFFSKTTMILLNNYFLIIALFTIVLGVFYPIFAREFFNSQISIGASYYNKIFAILLVPFLIFLAMSYFVVKAQPKPMIVGARHAAPLLGSTIITIAFIIKANNASLLEYSLIFLATFCTIIAAISKKNASNIAHLGFATILLGIILNSYLGYEKEISIKEGAQIQLSRDSKLKFDNIEYYAGKNFIARKANFTLYKNDKTQTQISPQMHYYPVSNQTTFEAAIHHTIFGDLYLAIGNKDENENYALRIYEKPFIYLIWLGCLLIFLAGFVKIAKIIIRK